jgi:hypothetical protein
MIMNTRKFYLQAMLGGSLIITSWRILRLSMEDSCNYTEPAGKESRQGVALQLGGLAWGYTPLTIRNTLVIEMLHTAADLKCCPLCSFNIKSPGFLYQLLGMLDFSKQVSSTYHVIFVKLPSVWTSLLPYNSIAASPS